MAAVVYVVVAGLVIIAILRGRRRARRAGEPDPARSDDRFIWIGGVIVAGRHPRRARRRDRDDHAATCAAASAGELHIDVVGKRWWWEVRYPDAGVRTANEIHVPVGRPIDIDARRPTT